MLKRAYVIKVDGTLEQLDHRPSLSEAQKIVGGDVEVVRGYHCTIYVNEEGKIMGKPANRDATMLMDALYGSDWIAGDALVLEGWSALG